MRKPAYSIREALSSDIQQWNSFVSHPLQTWEWGNFRKQMGVDTVRLIVEKNNHISQCWQLTFHAIPHTPYTVGYFPKGPHPDHMMIEELKKLGRKKHAIYIQLEPNEEIKKSWSPPHPLLLSHHPLFTKYTFVLDLTKSEEEMLKLMHNKTRYNIRLAQKHGVIIREDSSEASFQRYLQLSHETTERQKFYAHSSSYHETMWNALSKSGIAKLFTATYNQEIVAAWIVFCLHDTLYYPYGASSRDHREVMAPNLMLWELMRWGKSHGFKKFDLWGAIGPQPGSKTSEPDRHDPWYGFHRFKEGYAPTLIEFVGSYDLVIQPFFYRLLCVADDMRWKILKMMK